jgi:molybdenum cofactor cytidylyltransferase
MAETLSDIGIIMLAAGYSKRFNADKRQARFNDGSTLLEATLANVPDSFTRRLLVLHPGDEALAESYAATWSICIADRASEGMGFSLSAGISQSVEWPALLIALADMPHVQPETYQSIQQAMLKHRLVRPYCQGRPGNPVGIHAEFYPALTRLSSDQGARQLLRDNSDKVFRLECLDWGITQDVDTPASLPAQKTDPYA